MLEFLLALTVRTRWSAMPLARTLALGIPLYVGMMWLHPWLFGPDPKIVLG